MSTVQLAPTSVHPTNVITVTAEQKKALKLAYQRLMEANRAHKERGLEFGKLCYELREQHWNQGSQKGKGFKKILAQLSISKTTAYRWLTRYEEEQLGTTWHQANKRRSAGKHDEFVLKGYLPPDQQDQWNKDIKIIGGMKQLWPLLWPVIMQFVHEQVKQRLNDKRRGKPASRRVQ